MQVKERLTSESETNQVSVQFGLLHFLRSCVELERATIGKRQPVPLAWLPECQTPIANVGICSIALLS